MTAANPSGILLPLIVITLACSPQLPADEAAWRIEEFRLSCERLQMELQSYQQRTNDARATMSAFEDSKKLSTKQREETEALKAECAALLAARRNALAGAEAKLTSTREAKTGWQLGSLRTRSGKTYEGVTIRAIVPEGIRISHQEGANMIPKEDLPEDLYRSLGFLLASAIEAARAHTLPDLTKLGLQADGSGDPKLKTREEILSEERHLTDAERFVNAQSAQATFKRAEAKALLAKSQPGSEAHERAKKLIEEAREIEEKLGLPDPEKP